jgi:hypothetical protein
MYNNGLPRVKNIYQRIFQKISQDNTGCWFWIGMRQKRGKHNLEYGHVKINKKQYQAHRIIYKLIYGDIPNELCVLHNCDVPYCVNPKHLRLGTRIDNVRDMDKRNRRNMILKK